LTGGAHEIAQHGNIGSVGAKAARVHGKAETLRELEIDVGVVQFRETEPCGGQHAIQAARVNRARRAVTLPRAARQLVKLLPIAFVPSSHANFKYARCKALDAGPM
jgi:hypothetical protein